MARLMVRFEVAVTDQPTIVMVPGVFAPLRVEAMPFGLEGPHRVEFWLEADDATEPVSYVCQVIGTKHPIPDGAKWRGTTGRSSEGLAWHLFELPEVP